jgi:hypothetical protein
MLLAIVVVLVIGGVAVAVGIGFGMVVAPRLGRLFDRLGPEAKTDADDHDEERRDRPD